MLAFDVGLLDEDEVGGVAEGDERVDGGDPAGRAGEPVLDEPGQHGLADTARAAGLVDDDHPPDRRRRGATTSSSGSGASQRRSRTRHPMPSAAQPLGRRAATGRARWPT